MLDNVVEPCFDGVAMGISRLVRLETMHTSFCVMPLHAIKVGCVQAEGYYIEKLPGQVMLQNNTPIFNVYRCRNRQECLEGVVGTCAKGRTGT